jgi:mannosyltransferase OCH1-like enzyme
MTPPVDLSWLFAQIPICGQHALSDMDHCIEGRRYRSHLLHIKNITQSVLPSYLDALRNLPPIPRLLHVCWRDRAIINSREPMVAHGLHRMRSLNPEYTLKVWDDGEMEAYIRSSPLVSEDDYQLLRVGRTNRAAAQTRRC